LGQGEDGSWGGREKERQARRGIDKRDSGGSRGTFSGGVEGQAKNRKIFLFVNLPGTTRGGGAGEPSPGTAKKEMKVTEGG